MKHGSLFSGIGGFDLAAEWMGWDNVFHCEWMEFPRKVLDYHFPNADSHIDICKTDFKKYANKIDILTGGFPCQPFSLAGKRKGTDDERYLWGEMLRAIQEIKPKFVIAENVFGITNIDGGLVFQQVCLDLENEGYEVQPFIIPAAAKNAPHRRDRCWFIAYANGNDGRSTDRESGCEESKTNGEREQPIYSRTWTTSNEGDASNTNGNTKGPSRTSGDVKTNRGKNNDEQSGGKQSSKFNIRRGEFLSNATNSNSDGFGKQWRYDGSRQNDARCNSPFKWSADSKNIDNGDSSTNIVRQSTINTRIGEQTNVETNQFATAEGICRLDTECDQFKGIIKLDRCETLNGGTLVQDGCEGIQSPQHRGMDKDCGDLSGNRTNECEDDGTIINRMERDATDTNKIGLQHKGESTELERLRFGVNNSQNNKTTWDNFPTQSPVCSGDDGIPTELDGITFSKWRAESIKGYGNAIVPQIAYQLFEIIQELNENN